MAAQGPDALATLARAVAEPEVALVSSAAEQLPAEHPAKPLLLVQAAVLSIGRGEARDAAGAARASGSALGAAADRR